MRIADLESELELSRKNEAALARDLEDVRQELHVLRRAVGGAPKQDLFRAIQAHQAVVKLTEQIFGEAPTVSQESEPELNRDYFVVSVHESGDVEDIVQRHQQWHSQLAKLVGDLASYYRLSLDVQ